MTDSEPCMQYQPAGTFRVCVSVNYNTKDGRMVTLIEPYDEWLMTTDDPALVSKLFSDLEAEHVGPDGCFSGGMISQELADLAEELDKTPAPPATVPVPSFYTKDKPAADSMAETLKDIVSRLEGIGYTLNEINTNLDRIGREAV